MARLVVFLLLASIAQAFSQTQSQKFSLGIKVAPTLTVARYRDRDLQKEYSPRFVPGYTIGTQIKFPLKDRYSFISEVGFSQKGRNTSFDDDGRNRGVYYFLDLSMALRKSFKVQIKKNVTSNINVNIGPNIEYWFGGHGRLKYSPGGSADYDIVFNQPRTSDFSKYYYNDVNRWLFGIDLGVGADASILRRQRVYTELRVTVGQTQLGKKKSSSSIELVPLPSDSLLAGLITLSLQGTYTIDFDTRESRKGKSTKDKEVKRKR